MNSEEIGHFDAVLMNDFIGYIHLGLLPFNIANFLRTKHICVSLFDFFPLHLLMVF